jgi:VWFA-related protein
MEVRGTRTSHGPTRRRRLSKALAALSIVSLAIPAAGQQTPPPPPPPSPQDSFGEVIEVRVVNLEVVVTDQSGERVPALGPEVFRLIVDGEEVPIEFFTEIRGGVAMASPGIAAGMELAPGIRPGEPVRTSYLVFIDDFFSVKRDRDDLLGELADQVASLGPGDLVAVVAFDGTGVETLTNWTGDVARIEEVLEAASKRPAAGLDRIAEQSRYDPADHVALLSERIRLGGEPVNLGIELTPTERYYADRLANQVLHAAQAAAASIGRFADPPGRKVMLLASGGWPFLPADFVAAQSERPGSGPTARSRLVYDPRVAGGSEIFLPLSDAANRWGYTIYPIDVPGLESGGGLGSSLRGGDPLFGREPAAALSRSGVGRGLATVREEEVHRSLEFLAHETGGTALLNARGLDAFEAAREDTRSFYWLGFTPAWRRDDSHHDVRVELTDPSLRVRTRVGYADRSLESERTANVESALYFGSVPYTEGLSLTFGRPQKGGRGTMVVPLRIEIPFDAVHFLAAPDGKRQARLELRIAVVDSAGDRAEVPVISLTVEAPGEPEPGDSFVAEEELKLRRDWHRVIVAIHDPTSGAVLTGSAELRP